MALQSPQSTVALGAGSEAPHYVDWGAIIAGAVVASGISILLFTFGTAIGLSMVSPWEGEGATKTAYFVTLGLWTLWVVVSSFMAGGYVSGRMRRRIGDGTEHEVEVRDGIHGIIVWALGLLIAALLLASGITSAAGTATTAAGLAAGGAASNPRAADTTTYTVDQLFRASGPAAAAAPTPAADAQATDMPANEPQDRLADTRRPGAAHQEVGRILTYGVIGGEVSADNKTYIAQRVAEQTGMTQAEAEARVNKVLTEAKQKADTARKVGIVIGFLTAAALAVAAAAAAFAAALGGRHRDQGTELIAFWRWH